MPRRENLLENLISEVIQTNRGIGTNQLYEDVNRLYCKEKGLAKLSKSLFFAHLNILIDNNIVEERGSDLKGKKVEHYLTDFGEQLLKQGKLELPYLRDKKTQISTSENSVNYGLKALYTLILYFNVGTGYQFKSEDALEYFLKQHGLSISSLLVKSESSLCRHQNEEYIQRILESPREEFKVFKRKFIRSHIYERGTILYTCDVRGITCEAILANKEISAFRYRKFSSDEIITALESLSNLNIFKPMVSG